jgi:hypothetical protein
VGIGIGGGGVSQISVPSFLPDLYKNKNWKYNDIEKILMRKLKVIPTTLPSQIL